MGDVGIAVCVVGTVGTVVLFITLPKLLLDGILTGAEAAAYAGILVVAIASAGLLTDVAPGAATLLAGGFIVGTAALMCIRHHLGARGYRALAARKIERCRKTIAFDPRNVGAHLMLAEAMRDAKRYEEAIAAYERALDREPRNRKAQRGLEDCIALQRAARGETWQCYACHAENLPRARRCIKCGTPQTRTHQPVSRANCIALWTAAGLLGATVVLANILIVCAAGA